MKLPTCSSFGAQTSRRAATVAVLAFLSTGAAILWTLADYGYHGDEPIYEIASQEIDKWLSLTNAEKLSAEKIDAFWKTNPYGNVHPSGLKWLNLNARRVFAWATGDPLYQSRALVALLFSFSLIAFLLAVFPQHSYLLWAAPLALLTMPRFFAQTHFAVTEMPMVSLLLLSWVAWTKLFRTRWYLAIALVLGFFWSVKITCWVLTAALVPCLMVAQKTLKWRHALRACAVLLLSAAVYYAINPDYWFHPISRMGEFLHQSLNRGVWTPISAMYFGTVYSQSAPLPYPFVMFGITTPLPHIALLLFGLASYPWRAAMKTEWGLPLAAMAFFPFALMLLPNSPRHDNERYLIPAYPFLAVITAMGAAKIAGWAMAARDRAYRTAAWALVSSGAVFCLWNLSSAFRGYHPHELSYYNELVGGLPGAERLGFETAYLVDVLTPDVIRRLNESCLGQSVYFPYPFPPQLGTLLQQSNNLWFIPKNRHGRIHKICVYGRPSTAFWMAGIGQTLRASGLTASLDWEVVVKGVPILQLFTIREASPAQ